MSIEKGPSITSGRRPRFPSSSRSLALIAGLSLSFSQSLALAAPPLDTADAYPGVVSTPEKLPATLTVVSPELNVRSAPSGKILFQLHKGMTISPLSTTVVNGVTWWEIQVHDQRYWVADREGNTPYLANPTDEKDRALLESHEIPRGYKLRINKANRTLTLLQGNGHEWVEQKTYLIGLSFSGDESPKEREGDGRTPTGNYYIAHVNPASWFGEDPDTGRALPSLQISYPNQFDAWRGLQEGQISVGDYRRITDAIEDKGIPSQYTDLGSFLMIHGGGASDWTLGCVAMNDVDLKELLSLLKTGQGATGTPIEIQ